MSNTDQYKEKARELRLQILAAELDKTKAEAIIAQEKARDEIRLEQERYASLNYSQIYNFFDPVLPGTVEDCINWTGLWSRRSPESDITVVFNSPGGGVIHGLALYDHLRLLSDKGHKITTECRGYAASMGGVLLQAGDERVVGPYAHIMIHEVSSMNIGKVSEQEDQMEFTKKLQDRLAEILTSRSTMTKAALKRKWKHKDWWLNAEEAVELGFADRIG
jgi:ATP-dependent Clp endopeptidase proteolytic subunit ClpP